MTIGIGTSREPRMCANLPGMLSMPFIGAAGEDRITRRGGPRVA
jgi:hypothetical protein